MRHSRTTIFAIVLLFATLPHALHSQNPERFQKEIDSIVALNQSVDKSNLILFTGSSSIRLWKGLKSAFPSHNVVGLGFGGSDMADLLYYTNQLIIPFKPVQVFIYEGDNDISSGKTADEILASADKILGMIRTKLPETEVVFISPKPSLRRWHLKEKYESFNARLEVWTKTKKNVKYADVWTPMLAADGTVKKDIFVEDNLHLNDKGYAIWVEALKKHIKKISK
jgi:lysophospholipase L1-like esterase